MTAAFQGNAFQPNAFQMGSDAAPTGLAVVEISDGNDTVMILHEQDQHVDHLGTVVSTIAQDADNECVFPNVLSVTPGSDLTTGTSHVVTFTASVGDGILVVLATNGNTHTATAGWTEVVDNESVVSYWRIIDGTEGGTMTITSSANSESVWYVYRIQGGTFDPQSTPAASTSLNAVTQDPPSLAWGWADKTLVLAAIAGDTSTSPITFTSGPSELASGFNGQETGGTSVPDAFLAVSFGAVDGSSLNPSAFNITAQVEYDLATIAIKGNCRVQQSIIALDDQDWTDFSDYGSVTPQAIPDLGPGPCRPPSATAVSYASAVTSTTHAITLPSGLAVGDRMIVMAIALTSSTMTGSPFPAGWTQFFYGSSNNASFAWKDYEPSDGTTVTVTLSSTSQLHGYSLRLAGETFDPTVAPGPVSEATGTSTTPDSPSGSTTWGADESLWVALATLTGGTSAFSGYPANMPDNNLAAGTGDRTAIATGTASTSTFDPATFTIAASVAWRSRTFAIKGTCFPGVLQASVETDSQDFTDLEDYGSYTSPLSGDGAAPGENFLLGTGDGLDIQDFTDEADYGVSVAPAIPDNNPDVAPSSLDDQDFTDLEDYGSVTPQAIPDNNPEVAPSSLDDQDFTDLADYGDFVEPAIDDNNEELAPSSLDDQDFTDHWDYSDYVLQLSDDFVLREDFILGDGQGLDTQDFTDEADYGDFVEPLSDDSVDFILGTGDGLDFQDFTDLEDYGYSVAPLSDDNNPEIAPSDLDTQDFTDLEDYGSVTPQAVPDQNPEVAPSSLDDQDFTDTADYGSITPQAIPDNNPEIAPSSLDDQDFTDTADYGDVVEQAIEDNNPEVAPSSLDDQDFTDLEDYGSFTAPLSDDTVTPEDFILGDGKGLDTQDFTDFSDYGYAAWLTPEDVTNVFVTGVEGVGEVGHACPVIYNGIPEPSPSYTEITDPSAVYATIADPSPSYTDITDPSATWVDISGTSADWEPVDDC